jgi:uncharacterized cupin superfamily protein
MSNSDDYSYVTAWTSPSDRSRSSTCARGRCCPHTWFNQTLCKVNESVVRLGVVEGEYHWHKHDDLDEFFFCVSGRFIIDLEDRAWSWVRSRAA